MLKLYLFMMDPIRPGHPVRDFWDAMAQHMSITTVQSQAEGTGNQSQAQGAGNQL